MGLSKDLLLRQVREAARLFEQAKETPSVAEAAEQRAKLLCRGLACSIRNELEREENETKNATLDKPASLLPSTPASRQTSWLKRGFLSESRAQVNPGTDSGRQAATTSSPRDRTTTEHLGSTSGSRVVVASHSCNDMPALRTAAERASIDYSRFDAVTAEVESDGEEATHEPGKLRWDEAYRIAHRCAGVIEEIRNSPLKPECKEELFSRTTEALKIASSAVASESLVSCSPIKGHASCNQEQVLSITTAPLGPPDRLGGYHSSSSLLDSALRTNRTRNTVTEHSLGARKGWSSTRHFGDSDLNTLD